MAIIINYYVKAQNKRFSHQSKGEYKHEASHCLWFLLAISAAGPNIPTFVKAPTPTRTCVAPVKKGDHAFVLI